jgi:hypothetical protein
MNAIYFFHQASLRDKSLIYGGFHPHTEFIFSVNQFH